MLQTTHLGKSKTGHGGHMTNLRLSIVFLVGLCLGSELALAHHGRGTRYDTSAEIEIHGTIRELVWRNPHVAILIDVANDQGEDVTWVIEHSNVSTLARLGYHRNSLRAAQKVIAVINPGSNGDPVGLCQRIILEDGTTIFVRGGDADPND